MDQETDPDEMERRFRRLCQALGLVAALIIAIWAQSEIRARAVGGSASEEHASYVIHAVEAGESLASIAKRYYGSASRFREIIEAHPELADGAVIRVGQEIRIPVSSDSESAR